MFNCFFELDELFVSFIDQLADKSYETELKNLHL